LYPRDSSPISLFRLTVSQLCAITTVTTFSILVYCSPMRDGSAAFWNPSIQRDPRLRPFLQQLMAHTTFRDERTSHCRYQSDISFLERSMCYGARWLASNLIVPSKCRSSSLRRTLFLAQLPFLTVIPFCIASVWDVCPRLVFFRDGAITTETKS
jgi:hypothetical protein